MTVTALATGLAFTASGVAAHGAVMAATTSTTVNNGPTSTAPPGKEISRIWGGDRFETAVNVSKIRFPSGGVHAVVLSRADSYADALAGTPLAASKVGPLLLTATGALNSTTETELKRVSPPNMGNTVYILGGALAVSDAVATTVTNDGYTVKRLAGADRWSTAVAIANEITTTPAAIILATGDSPADALAGGAAAAKAGGVVLLTNDSQMPAPTSTYLSDHSKVPVYALGGPAAAADPSATSKIIGADRYETAVKVAQAFFPSPTSIGFAQGYAFADALSGGAGIAEIGGPMVLVDPQSLPPVVHDYIVSIHANITDAEAYGGPAVIPDGELAAMDSAMRGT